MSPQRSAEIFSLTASTTSFFSHYRKAYVTWKEMSTTQIRASVSGNLYKVFTKYIGKRSLLIISLIYLALLLQVVVKHIISGCHLPLNGNGPCWKWKLLSVIFLFECFSTVTLSQPFYTRLLHTIHSQKRDQTHFSSHRQCCLTEVLFLLWFIWCNITCNISCSLVCMGDVDTWRVHRLLWNSDRANSGRNTLKLVT